MLYRIHKMSSAKVSVTDKGLMEKSFEIEDRRQRQQVQLPEYTSLPNQLYFENNTTSSSRYILSNCLCSCGLHRTFLAYFVTLRSLTANSIVFPKPATNIIVKKRPSLCFHLNFLLFFMYFILSTPSIQALNKDGYPPLSTNDVETINKYRGDIVRLSCNVARSSRHEVVWFKDGEQISSDWSRFKKKRSRLQIRNVQPSDSGLYQCQVVIGYKRSPIMVVKLDVRDAVSTTTSGRQQLARPIFSQPVKMRRHSFVKPEGGSVSFRCKAKGRPRPKIQWLKDGNQTEMKGTGTNGKRQWILTLRNLQVEDGGIFTCRVWNSEGEISFDYTLRVVPRNHERPVLVKPHPVNTSVHEGERASFQCRVRSKLPPTVKWIKKIDPSALRIFKGKLPNDTLQIANNYYLFLPAQEMMILPDGSYLNKLVIPRARLVDSGMYICLGANTQGYNFRYAHLVVNPVDDPVPNRRLSANDQALPLAAMIGVPAGIGLFIVCIITIYCARNRDRLAHWSSMQKQAGGSNGCCSGAARLSTSSSSFSARNIEIGSEARYETDPLRPQTSDVTPSPSPLPMSKHSLLEQNGLHHHEAEHYPFINPPAPELVESDFASTYAQPPPPPPSQHSKSSCSRMSSSMQSASYCSCSNRSKKHHHSSRKKNFTKENKS